MDVTPLPDRPDPARYRRLAHELAEAAATGDADAQRRLRSRQVDDNSPGPGGRPAPTLADAEHTIAAEHGFENWTVFMRHLEALAVPESPIAQFESAADAIVDGALARLEAQLHANPGLAHARSGRIHRATLLHYVAANGIEDYRQRTPPNAVDVARCLLAAGADVDAPGDMYGPGATTLGLVASSVHPARAGLQNALIDTLLDAGAAIDGLAGGWTPLGAALANGRGDAARHLADRGARLDTVATAAGAGRLDRVKALLESQPDVASEAGSAAGAARASTDQLSLALSWASLYGHDDVVAYLLDRGQDPAVLDRSGQSALHLAVHAGQLSTIDLLIRRGAPLEVRNVYGGTALGQAIWSAHNDGPGDYPQVVERLVDAGADVTTVRFPTGIAAIDAILARRDPRR